MSSIARFPVQLWRFGMWAFVVGSFVPVTQAAAALPDPCKLITVAEFEQIAGPLKSPPQAGDSKSGDLSCEYKTSKTPAWVSVRLQEGELSYWKDRNGGANSVLLPEFGKDAFVNPDFEGLADLYAKQGRFVLRVTTPKGATAVDTLKALARKALPRS